MDSHSRRDSKGAQQGALARPTRSVDREVAFPVGVERDRELGLSLRLVQEAEDERVVATFVGDLDTVGQVVVLP